jgi:uncharacterized protein (TIGR04255 family)
MPSDLPRYEAPPVVETVLSAQFTPLREFTVAHGGLFWKKYLDATWTSIAEEARLEDAFERFGPDRMWKQNAIQLVAVGSESQRLQVIRNDKERMIQVQNSRFVQNWRKGAGSYPTYSKLLPEFEDHFGRFSTFVADEALGDMELNQWEVIYVNILPRGELWTSPNEWKCIFPWLREPTVEPRLQLDSSSSNEWQFSLPENAGRLFVSMNHVKLGAAKGDQEAIKFQIMARGPVDREKGMDLRQGFDLAHETIVRSFTSMTSDAAHKHWNRTA